ncbi:N-acetylmuramic acid 6-phosphate etherase [Paraflavisolibacter sp. H34]|uniref:N-acetylmuramic acid 6-phosphate etherase n=1 Tax=Huijunlia imazamoxiresistens TaxID=3127457 RepID=UPI003015CA28
MPEFKKLTEEPGPYRHLEKMPVAEVLAHINSEDKTVAAAVEKALPQVERLVVAIVDKMAAGGRLFYIGAGTSGRLGVLDASEVPPTFGMAPGRVVGLIAGGEKALTAAVEFAEDSATQGWADLQQQGVGAGDVVVGLAASGTTPYVVGALEACRQQGILTGGITNNPGSPLARLAHFPVEVPVGPEVVTGSTRMKAGTAQKMVLNMISTAVMIRLGRVEDNRMVHLHPTNAKLLDRGARMLLEKLPLLRYEQARALLVQYGSVKKALAAYRRERSS